MVTPPECSTTLICTDAGSLRRAFRTAVTSTRSPGAGAALTSPLTPLISTDWPGATCPSQRQSWAGAATATATKAAARAAPPKKLRLRISAPLLFGVGTWSALADGDGAAQRVHGDGGAARAGGEAQI